MGKALAVDLRLRVVAAYHRGAGTQAQVAKLFGVGEASVRRWVRLERETGGVEPRLDFKHGPPRKIDVVQLSHLEEVLAVHPDATNAVLAELLAERTGVEVSASSISRAVAVLGWTRKKKLSSPAKPTPRVSAIFVRSGSSGSEA